MPEVCPPLSRYSAKLRYVLAGRDPIRHGVAFSSRQAKNIMPSIDVALYLAANKWQRGYKAPFLRTRCQAATCDVSS
jgi:hypothetical protein